MASSKFSFPGHGGRAPAVRLELPDDAPRAFALFAHCFTCGKDNLAAARDIPEAVAVATIAAPAEPAHVARQFGAVEEKLETQDEVGVELGSRRSASGASSSMTCAAAASTTASRSSAAPCW